GNAPPAADKDQFRRVERIREVRREGCGISRGQVADVAHDDDPPRRHERRALRGVEHGGDRILARLRAAALTLASCASRNREVLARKRAVVVTEETAHELVQRGVAKDRISAANDVRAHASAPGAFGTEPRLIWSPSRGTAPAATVGGAAVAAATLAASRDTRLAVARSCFRAR